MRTIYKFTIPATDEYEVEMPRGAEIIDAKALTISDINVWAICDSEAEPETRTLAVVGTGNPMPDDAGKGNHVATVIATPFIWHIFDVTEQPF